MANKLIKVKAEQSDQMIENFLEDCSLEDLKDVAVPNCSVCCGLGYYIDDPSPPGLYITAGDYTYICDCLDDDLILDRF